MKKTLLFLFLTFLSLGSLRSQCVYTCSNYAVSPITFTTFPSGTNNVIPSFTNTFLGTFADDGSIGPIPIGFNFDFYCNTYTAVHICSNGFIMLDYQPFPWPTQYVHPTQSLPDANVPNGMIAFNMTDLDPGVGGTITYTTVGAPPNRMFIVTYSNVPCFSSSSDLNTGQIVLFETSNLIEIHTTSAKPDINQGTLGSTQGIENTTGTDGVTPPGRNANDTWGASAANTAYRFGPYTPTPPSSLTGNTVLCEGELGNYQASFITSATGYNWTLPSGWSGTSTISTLSAYAGASGGVSVSATYSCGTSIPTVLNTTVNTAPVVAINSLTPPVICSGKTITVTVSGAASYTLNPGAIPSSVSTLTDMPLISTVYTLTGTGSNGCVSVNNPTTTVTVLETPIVTVNSGSICIGETFTVMPNGAPNYVIAGLPFGTTSPTVAGQYSYAVTGTGTNGCVSDPAVSSLTVYSLPNVGASASRTVMCTKESVILTASGANTYSWSTSATNVSLTVSPITTTLYMVTGTDLQGCSNSQTVTIQVKPCTGVEELSGTLADVKVVPNPTSGNFELRFNSPPDGIHIEIYNALGQLILSEKASTEKLDFDLTNYSNGLYYVKLKNSNEQKPFVIKVVKQ